MPFCINCGKEISSEAAFCPSCGTRTNFAAPSTSENPAPGSSGKLPADAAFLDAREVVMKKKIFSMREHYDFEDPSGRKLGEGDGNFFQVPAKFVIFSTSNAQTKQELMHVDGKLISLRHEFRF
ncbi:MAG: zinc ribbon domain-containing protein, partial [Nitrososphaerales archaeon]